MPYNVDTCQGLNGRFCLPQTAAILWNARRPWQALGKRRIAAFWCGMKRKKDSKRKQVMALFGNVAIPRAFCPDCKHMAFVIRGRFNCCGGRLTKLIPRLFVREAEPENVRRLPPKEYRDYQLNKQDNRCFYCDALFGDEGFRNQTPVRIKLTWDHQLPFAYSQDNRNMNFVAACQVCNGIKSAMVFQTVDEAKAYLSLRRKSKGYDW